LRAYWLLPAGEVYIDDGGDGSDDDGDMGLAMQCNVIHSLTAAAAPSAGVGLLRRVHEGEGALPQRSGAADAHHVAAAREGHDAVQLQG
jgi:hypothetical protein